MKAKTNRIIARARLVCVAALMPGVAFAQSYGNGSLTNVVEELASGWGIPYSFEGLMTVALFGAMTLVAVPTIAARFLRGRAFALDVFKRTAFAVALFPTVLGAPAGVILYARAVLDMVFGVAPEEAA